jgi:tetratricopeptide (TPR) repeat protein
LTTKINDNMKKYFILALCAASLSMASCTKELEQKNPNQQTTDTYWLSADDALKGINAAYQTLIIDAGYMRATPILLDTRGDDMRSESPWDQMYNSGKFNMNAGNDAIYGWAFTGYYQGINRANQVIDFAPSITMDANLKNRILGQAYFLRGLYFYHLVNMYGNVSLPTTTKQLYFKQSTPEEGWAQVIADLKKASELLPTSYDNITGADKGQTGRATKGAALGFLGKAYLFNKKYTEAEATFKSVMDLNMYDLVANYSDNFGIANENNKESIFEVQFSADAGGKDMNWGGEPAPTWGAVSGKAITYGARGFGWTDVQPTRYVYNEFLVEKTAAGKSDPRLDATIFYNRPGMTIYGQDFATYYKNSVNDLNDLYCKKYSNDGIKANEFDWRSGINDRLLRYSDILLMYAECLNERGATAEAVTFVQRVRSRVGLPNLATVKPNMTQAQFREQLAHERLLEFCLEGHRFDDIRRWGWLENPTKLAELKSHDPEFNTYKAGREFYPIPQTEINTNPAGVKQNATY